MKLIFNFYIQCDGKGIRKRVRIEVICRIWIRTVLKAVLAIRMFLGLLDPDPLVRGTDPEPSIIKQ
jgi:hypothetical protein